MKKMVCVVLCVMFATSLLAVEPPEPYGVVPSRAHLAWHEIEFYGLICLNMPTFTGEEWAYGDKPASTFNPTDFSADQIISASKNAGMNGVVLVCKHHGGLCLWPTKTTEYSIKNSPWKEGKGDMVKEFADAARKHGLKFGAYISPWDRNHPEYGRPEYVKVYREQWREIMSNYGELFEVWLDGANGGTGWYGGAKGRRNINRETYYDWPTTFELMRKLQPGALIFSDVGPGTRWVGNERGHAGDPCWATVTYPLVKGKPAGPGSNVSRDVLGSGVRNGQQWTPAEADTPIRKGWYYHPKKKLKSLSQLINTYYLSIGRGASFNLGLSPDKRGRMHEGDVALLKQLGDWKKATFSVNLAEKASAEASSVRGGSDKYRASNVLDGNADTYWCTDDDKLVAELVLDMGKDIQFNVVNIREYLPLGQRIDDWAIDVWGDGKWREIAKGTAIGSRRLVRSKTKLNSSKVRLRITRAAACPAIREFTLHCEPDLSNSVALPPAKETTSGMSKAGWKILDCSYAAPGSGLASHAIDGNTKTLWHTHGPDREHGGPQYISVDMGKEVTIRSFLYMPRQDGTSRAIVDTYQYHVSSDGKNWTKVAAGEFANIGANPIQQETRLKKAVKARYFKFVALHSVNGIPLSAAELGVIAK